MRLLVLALAAIGAAAGAVVLAFVAAVWRISRDLDVTPTPCPECEDEEPHGMPTTFHWSTLDDRTLTALNRGIREAQADQLVPWTGNGTYSRLD